MRPHLLTELTAKAIAGVAAITIAAGSAGAVVATRTISDEKEVRATEAADETTTTTEAQDQHERERERDEATTTTEAQETDVDAATESETASGLTAHPENFGAQVSADARDGGVDGQEIAAVAHDRNEERQAAQPHPATRSAEHRVDHADDDEHGGPQAKPRGRR